VTQEEEEEEEELRPFTVGHRPTCSAAYLS